MWKRLKVVRLNTGFSDLYTLIDEIRYSQNYHPINVKPIPEVSNS
jgi:hypothetical protein